MNSKNITPLNQDMCMCCLKEKATHKYHITGRGYGSQFDMESTHWQCCDKCHKDEYDLWSNEVCRIDEDEYYETYQHEEDILDFIHNLPIESQELFFNTFSDYNNMDAQDWIDYELNELAHEKCKDYSLYSPQEKTAYKERFPNCDKVYKKVWSDGSSGCYCLKGASGNADGTCDEDNVSHHCYMCTLYNPRKGNMKIINEIDEYYENEKSRLENMLKYATERLKELENDKVICLEKHRYDN